MQFRGSNGRFVREDREEGLNINIDIFTILKYIIAFSSFFP